MPKHRKVKLLSDISMTGVVRLISSYSDMVSNTSYLMSNNTTVHSDVKIQEFIDSRIDWIKTFVFTGKLISYSFFILIVKSIYNNLFSNSLVLLPVDGGEVGLLAHSSCPNLQSCCQKIKFSSRISSSCPCPGQICSSSDPSSCQAHWSVKFAKSHQGLYLSPAWQDDRAGDS